MSATVCVHGSLARACEICERDAEIAQLRQVHRMTVDNLQATIDALADRGTLHAALRDANNRAEQAEREREEARARWTATIDELGRVIHILAGTDDIEAAVQACQPHASDLARAVVAERDALRAELAHWRAAAASVGESDGHGMADTITNLRLSLSRLEE